eukprot:2250487-Prymnesium_polylepis.1
MVLHMIAKNVVETYVPQWATALKPGGKLFHTDHNPLDGGTTGPRRPMSDNMMMSMNVTPSDTEAAEIVAGGFVVEDGPFDWLYYPSGYAALYAPALS